MCAFAIVQRPPAETTETRMVSKHQADAPKRNQTRPLCLLGQETANYTLAVRH